MKVPVLSLLVSVAATCAAISRDLVPAYWIENIEATDTSIQQSLVFTTTKGVLYTVERSHDLVGWTPDETFGLGGEIYGMSHDCVVPMRQFTPPTASPPGGGTPPAGQPPLNVSIRFQRCVSGGTVASWPALSGSGGVSILIPGELDDGWDDLRLFWKQYGDYRIFVWHPLGVLPAPAVGSLSQEDAAFRDALVEHFGDINNEVDLNQAEVRNAPPPAPPSPDSKVFWRIRANWSIDTDQDGSPDWAEFELMEDEGHPFHLLADPFNADVDSNGVPDGDQIDSDGDGVTDSQNNIPLAVSPPGALQRPPVATIEHRHVTGGRLEQTAGLNSFVFGFAYDSNGYIWSEPSDEIKRFEDATSFGGVTGAVSGLALPPVWEEGVVSLEAKNKEQEINFSGLFEKEWINFKTEYRLRLSGPAPKGGYRIPLTFGKVHFKWNSTSSIWLPAAPPAAGEDTLVLELIVPEGATVSPPVPVPFLQPVANRAITLVPADVTILEGAGAVPVDGLCVNLLETFALDFNGTERDTVDDLIPDEWITWQSRRLQADASFEAWSTFRLGNFGPEKTGNSVAVSKGLHGIFQVRAVLTPPDADPIYFPAVRMRDATNPIDSLGSKKKILTAGQPEYFGVVNEQKSLDVRNKAVSWLGSLQYAREANVSMVGALIPPQRNPSTQGSDKCNIFIAHVIGSVSAPVPYYTRWNFAVSLPLARADWFSEPEENVDLDAYNWKDWGTTGAPFPGMVVSYGGMGPSGHCAILDYDGAWIAAGPESVNKYDSMADTTQIFRTVRMRGYQTPF